MARYRKKKRTGTLAVMIVLIIVSIAVVLIVYGVSSGVISLPGGESSQAVSSEVSVSEPPPPEPPKISAKDVSGAGLTEKIADLSSMLDKNAFSVSLYYYDLSNGNEIEFNSLKKYSSGSVIKAPYCRWLISSGADLNESLTLSERDILEGSGTLQNEPVGTQHTVSELIEMAIVSSDNTAYMSLLNKFGVDGYNAYAKSLGVSAGISASNPFGLMSAAGAGVLFGDIYKFNVSSPDQAGMLIDLMENTDYQNLISTISSDIPIAHKYGYNNGNGGFHDAAIVYRDPPYILTIFTTLNPDKSGTAEYIQNLAREVDNIHQSIH